MIKILIVDDHAIIDPIIVEYADAVRQRTFELCGCEKNINNFWAITCQ